MTATLQEVANKAFDYIICGMFIFTLTIGTILTIITGGGVRQYCCSFK